MEEAAPGEGPVSLPALGLGWLGSLLWPGWAGPTMLVQKSLRPPGLRAGEQ